MNNDIPHRQQRQPLINTIPIGYPIKYYPLQQQLNQQVSLTHHYKNIVNGYDNLKYDSIVNNNYIYRHSTPMLSTSPAITPKITFSSSPTPHLPQYNSQCSPNGFPNGFPTRAASNTVLDSMHRHGNTQQSRHTTIMPACEQHKQQSQISRTQLHVQIQTTTIEYLNVTNTSSSNNNLNNSDDNQIDAINANNNTYDNTNINTIPGTNTHILAGDNNNSINQIYKDIRKYIQNINNILDNPIAQQQPQPYPQPYPYPTITRQHLHVNSRSNYSDLNASNIQQDRSIHKTVTFGQKGNQLYAYANDDGGNKQCRQYQQGIHTMRQVLTQTITKTQTQTQNPFNYYIQYTTLQQLNGHCIVESGTKGKIKLKSRQLDI